MKFGSGALLVAVGLLVLWLAVSGKLSNLSDAWNTLNGDAGTEVASGSPLPVNKLSGFPAEAFPSLPAPAV